MDSFEQMGHTLALQYGGSEAHATFFQRQRGDWEAATQSRDLLTSVRRFYSGMYTDAEKQVRWALKSVMGVPEGVRRALFQFANNADLAPVLHG